jgi:hypothetical protein
LYLDHRSGGDDQCRSALRRWLFAQPGTRLGTMVTESTAGE